MKTTVLSMMVLVGALATTEALAQGYINQNGREFRPGREGGVPSRAGREVQRRSPRDAYAARGFDGGWSVAISTRSGACDPQYRFGLQIINNRVVYEGRAAGQVSPGGAVSVAIAAGDQRASGQGRLSGARGSGVWRGYGSAGSCAGTWVAQRH
jgi:hypothetical protein